MTRKAARLTPAALRDLAALLAMIEAGAGKVRAARWLDRIEAKSDCWKTIRFSALKANILAVACGG